MCISVRLKCWVGVCVCLHASVSACVCSKNADLHALREQIFIYLRAGTLLSYDRLRALMH